MEHKVKRSSKKVRRERSRERSREHRGHHRHHRDRYSRHSEHRHDRRRRKRSRSRSRDKDHANHTKNKKNHREHNASDEAVSAEIPEILQEVRPSASAARDYSMDEAVFDRQSSESAGSDTDVQQGGVSNASVGMATASTPQESAGVEDDDLKPETMEERIGKLPSNLQEIARRAEKAKIQLRNFVLRQKESRDKDPDKHHDATCTEDSNPVGGDQCGPKSGELITISDKTAGTKDVQIEGDEEVEVEEDVELDDMFNMDSISSKKATKIVKKKRPTSSEGPACQASDEIDTQHIVRYDNLALAENWDDAEGYYKSRIGETLEESRYEVVAEECGRGVFSSVLRCRDRTDQRFVAIKVIRNNPMMKKAAEKEMNILRTLNHADKEDKKHCVRLLRHFEFRGHLCLVFEWLHCNLRMALKKWGQGKGLRMKAVWSYSKQLFTALKHLRRCRIMHADLKPDNILISEDHRVLKVCDLGSASDVHDNEITAYLVSRYYRAPEVILGCKYDSQIDVWAAGCTIFELITGKVLFQGRSNNEMLKIMMEVKGKFAHKMIRAGILAKQHFNDNLDFMYVSQDNYTKKEITKPLHDLKQTKNIESMLLSSVKLTSGAGNAAAKNKLKQMADFIEKCLALDPTKRITPDQSLQHPWIRQAFESSPTNASSSAIHVSTESSRLVSGR
eukprot:GHVL01022624.1.p1 GENE.GHVL01022624.1~~GHVL01022624.1.p1  ORF type:complete len:677 (-),score=100.16 GHVL01022624.1:1373-3403(-)